MPAGCFVAAAHLADGLPAQANGQTDRLLADARGQRQQRLRAAHRPHRLTAGARKLFEGGLVSRRKGEESEGSGYEHTTQTC